jgi:hypothetical protein
LPFAWQQSPANIAAAIATGVFLIKQNAAPGRHLFQNLLYVKTYQTTFLINQPKHAFL